MAATELQAIVRFRLRFGDGAVDEFKRLSAQCMEWSAILTQDTGTLQYDIGFK